jgi:L-fuconolactonase
MFDRADAHVHFFRGGYADSVPESCRRVRPSEISLYEALMEKYSIRRVLAIGYEGQPFAAGNNSYLAELAESRPWLVPIAYADNPAALDVPTLKRWREQRFAGVSIYLFNNAAASALHSIRDDVWEWLVERRWLISVNSKVPYWSIWPSILSRFPALRVLVSHLGLPAPAEREPDKVWAKFRMTDVLALAEFPGVNVKLSGFYALTQPSYAYPHRSAWPYVELVHAAFGPQRLLWGSDFAPSLEHVSFPQTLSLFDEMPFFSENDHRQIMGANLMRLIEGIQ